MRNNMQTLPKIRDLRKNIFDARIKTDNDVVVESNQALPQSNQSLYQVSTCSMEDFVEPAIASVETPATANKKHKAIHPSIQVLIDKDKESDMLDFEQEWLAAKQYKQEYLYPRLKDASSKCYKKWLKGYIAQGGIPTHYYDYDWHGFIATDDIVLKPLFGAQSIDIIVPYDINIEGHTGHCNVFLMKDFTYMGWGDFVPVYKDTIVYEQ